MRIVLDTNVLVSGLLNPYGAPGRVLGLVVNGDVAVLFDDRIMGEYRAVLARPKFRIAPSEAAAILDLIEQQGIPSPAPPLSLILPDPDDLMFLEVAEGAYADALVTGNGRHFAPAADQAEVPILSPAEFLERWSLRDE